MMRKLSVTFLILGAIIVSAPKIGYAQNACYYNYRLQGPACYYDNSYRARIIRKVFPHQGFGYHVKKWGRPVIGRYIYNNAHRVKRYRRVYKVIRGIGGFAAKRPNVIIYALWPEVAY